MTKVISFVSNATSLDNSEIESLLQSIQQYNNQNNIKGGIVYINNTFFQILEGSPSLVETLYQKICTDKRHYNVIKIYDQPLNENSYFNQFDINIITKNKTIAFQELQRILDFNAVNIPQLYTFISYQAIKLLNFTPSY